MSASADPEAQSPASEVVRRDTDLLGNTYDLLHPDHSCVVLRLEVASAAELRVRAHASKKAYAYPFTVAFVCFCSYQLFKSEAHCASGAPGLVLPLVCKGCIFLPEVGLGYGAGYGKSILWAHRLGFCLPLHPARDKQRVEGQGEPSRALPLAGHARNSISTGVLPLARGPCEFRAVSATSCIRLLP